MKSSWIVTKNYIGDKEKFAAYRIIDTSEVDHSGNREYQGGWHDNEETATRIAQELNAKGE